jgi:leucyl aminopeptidase
MDIRALKQDYRTHICQALLCFVFEGDALPDWLQQVDQELAGAISTVVTSGDFKGGAAESAVVYTRGAMGCERIVLVGLGSREKISAEGLRRASASAVLKSRSLKLNTVSVMAPACEQISAPDVYQAMAEGMGLALYAYHGQKSSEAPADLPAVVDFLVDDAASCQAALNDGVIIARGTNLARELANLPPNICQPAYLAQEAVRLGADTGLKVRVLEPRQMKALRMGALLAVAQGSDAPARFIVLEHNAERAEELDTIVLVGKGVTFDTGGYSLKTADGMVGMKGDMSGAAAVLGAMSIISRLKLPVHVVGLVPAVENMVSGGSYRPQDVVTASNGKTIEIISTDAEGRLILADALVYAQRYQPNVVIDIATLTGAISVALGGAAAGVYGNSDAVFHRLQAAGEATFERVWQMPLYEEYGKPIESDTADMKNSAGAAGRGGGAGIAAYFLRNFVDYDWAHIDMAGMMNHTGEIAYMPKNSARGYGARLLAEFVRQWKA